MKTEESVSSHTWVFGYGSLLWNPGFSHGQSMIGYIKNFKRRFWQGNDCHRGTPEQLGRVVTLIPDKESITWGRAYQLVNTEKSREYLDQREVDEGGYETSMIEFYPLDDNLKPFLVSVYIATPKNRLFLGPGPSETIAKDIASSEGKYGHNVEYLARISAFMRLIDKCDNHIRELETIVKQIITRSNPNLIQYFQLALRDEAFRILDSLDKNSKSNELKLLPIKDFEAHSENYENEIEQIFALPEWPVNAKSKFFATAEG